MADDVNQTLLSQLQNVLPKAFQASLDTIIVPQAPYNAAYGGNIPGGDARRLAATQLSR